MNGISQALSVSHERTGLSTNVTNDTIPFNYHYDITIELGNAAGSINLTGDLSKLPSIYIIIISRYSCPFNLGGR